MRTSFTDYIQGVNFPFVVAFESGLTKPLRLLSDTGVGVIGNCYNHNGKRVRNCSIVVSCLDTCFEIFISLLKMKQTRSPLVR